MKRKLNLKEREGSDAELLDVMDQAIGQFQIALAEDGISFNDERDVRRQKALWTVEKREDAICTTRK